MRIGDGRSAEERDIAAHELGRSYFFLFFLSVRQELHEVDVLVFSRWAQLYGPYTLVILFSILERLGRSPVWPP